MANETTNKPGEGQTVVTKSQTKDLISLQNARNGEVYKFACKTCIDGHRAPLCDPKKHRGKIMFRRPAPGRPARQCGHPKSAQCDCLAKRTLCCVLTSEQWDEVVAQRLVSVEMYDTQEDLDAAQSRRLVQSPPVPSPFSEARDASMSNESYSSISTPTPVPQMNMFGAGGPQANHSPGPDPFAWSSEASQIPIFPPPQFQLMPQAFTSSNGSPYQQLEGNYRTQTPGIQQVDIHPGNDPQQPAPLNPWPHPRPEYLPFESQAQWSAGQNAQYETLALNQLQLDPHLNHIQDSQSFAPSGLHAQFDALSPSPYQSVLSDFAIDPRMPIEEHFDPSETPTLVQNISQSCCSSKRSQPLQMNSFEHWQFPQPAPTSQFPCPSCASTMCTCMKCPEVMQDFSRGGAWSRACGRDGHLDAVPPPLPPQNTSQQSSQSLPPPAAPVAKKSCCGGGDSSQGSTAPASPFIQPNVESSQHYQQQQPSNLAAPQWIQQPLELRNRGGPFGADLTLDPSMLYHTPSSLDHDWGSMG